MSINNKKKDYARFRREGRVLAFQSIYAYDFYERSIDELLKFEWIQEDISDTVREYASFLVKGTIGNLIKIDEVIKSKLINWDFSRISSIDKAILRFSIFSMLFEDDLPEKVIINEAVEIVKEFGSEDSYKFVNGILDAVKRSKK